MPKLSLLSAVLVAMLVGPPLAQAAEAPIVVSTSVTNVTSSAANLRAEINPGGLSTTYRFEFVSEAAYQANLAANPPKDGFVGATKAPLGGEPGIGADEAPVAVVQHIGGLSGASAYRYRVVATNGSGSSFGPTRPLMTDETSAVFSLLDGRGWEMVSPVDKNGGQVAAPETLFGGGVLQAAAAGGAITYGSAFSFGSAAGAPGASQYLSRREAGGWSTQNLTVPLVSGSYPREADSGVPYQLFSPDLGSALLSNGKRCRGDAVACPVANPPLPGSGAPAQYRNYYLRSASGSFQALLSGSSIAGLALGPEEFEVAFVGATPDLSQAILSSCAALTADATEIPGSGGECDPAKQNLYRWSPSGLLLINLLPGETAGTPGATLAAQGAGAVSFAHTYFTVGSNLYDRGAGHTSEVDETVGGGGAFQLAAGDGSVAFFTKSGHLYRYEAAGAAVTDLTPAGGVLGVLGASADGSYLYYLTTAGLMLRHGAATTLVAAAADASNYPPATGSARVSADGTHLAFVSSAELTGFDNAGHSEVFVYSAPTGTLTCASCNPSGERPIGSSSIPGAVANGKAVQAYKPRVLSVGGTRLFFDSSDSLVLQDSNNEPDVYEWEAQGTGSCARPGGCVGLVSSGRDAGGASFIDASADGGDVFFLTGGSLVASDPGSVDVYDARVGGGFPVPEPPIPCVGDACQVVPGEPEDPTPGTIVSRPQGNPPLTFANGKKKKAKKHRKHAHDKRGRSSHGKRSAHRGGGGR